MLNALSSLVAAAVEAEAEEPSKTLFYVAGIILTVFALVVAAIGIRGHERFPPTRAAARGVMLLAVVLVAFTMASAVITS